MCLEYISLKNSTFIFGEDLSELLVEQYADNRDFFKYIIYF